MLCAVAVDSKELRYRKFELTKLLVLVSSVPVKVDQVLDGAFSISGFADHDASPIILDCACKDFRSRRAVTIYEYSESPSVDNCRVGVTFYLDTTFRVFNLYDRALLDKKARQSCCFGQCTATIAPQIDDQAVGVFCL